MPRDCRVYWGSHGCIFDRGHEGPCMCECAWDESGSYKPREESDEEGPWLNVGAPPYYGKNTRFYGEDVQERGLPQTGTPDPNEKLFEVFREAGVLDD